MCHARHPRFAGALLFSNLAMTELLYQECCLILTGRAVLTTPDGRPVAPFAADLEKSLCVALSRVPMRMLSAQRDAAARRDVRSWSATMRRRDGGLPHRCALRARPDAEQQTNVDAPSQCRDTHGRSRHVRRADVA